jgi:hypothetical protein
MHAAIFMCLGPEAFVLRICYLLNHGCSFHKSTKVEDTSCIT